jgi:single-strand DNA-binding protein
VTLNFYNFKRLTMAMSLNRVQLIGNLTRDPELRQIPGGQTVASFSIATNFSWTDSSGQRQEKAEYHNVVVWRKLAEIAGQYLRKGSKVFVEGRLQTREWEGDDGVKRYRTEIVVDNMIMLDRKGDMAGGGAPAYSGGLDKKNADDGSVAAGAAMMAEGDVSIDDLPF